LSCNYAYYLPDKQSTSVKPDKLVLQLFNKTSGRHYKLAKTFVHITFTSTSLLTVLLTCGIISPMMLFLQSLYSFKCKLTLQSWTSQFTLATLC